MTRCGARAHPSGANRSFWNSRRRYGAPLCLTRQCCNGSRWNTHSTPFFARLAHEKYRARRSRLGPLRRGADGRPDRCAGSAGDGRPAWHRRRKRPPPLFAPASGGLLRFFRLCLVAPGTWCMRLPGSGESRHSPRRRCSRGRGGAIAAIEEEALAHMNRDHRDAVQLYATRHRDSRRQLDDGGGRSRRFSLVEGSRSARVA